MSTTALDSIKPSDRKNTPPRPPLVFHVGVIGHRPDPQKRPSPDVDALRLIIVAVLRRIREAVAGLASAKGELFSLDETGDRCTGTLRIISSLAEGADQWVADEAVRVGYDLQVPMPFSVSEYEKDFQGPALGEFKRLKDQASSILQLDGCRARQNESYEAAGRVVIGQSDLVIAVWDGSEEKGRGGTGQMVRESLKNGVPVIWIKWAVPQQWQLLDTPQWRILEDANELKGESTRLTRLVTNMLLPPDLQTPQNQPVHVNGRERYYREVQRRWNGLGCLWRLLRGLVLIKPAGCVWRLDPYKEITKKDWQKEWDGCHSLDKSLVEWIDDPYVTHYAWANQLAIHYGGLHRSSSALNYLLGTLAVLFALLGISSLIYGHRDVATILLELVAIAVIIIFGLWAAIGRWHERWIEYRILAERLRIARFQHLLGGARQHFSLPGHLISYGNPANTWMYWHYRAVARAAGLAEMQFDDIHLGAVQKTWRDVLLQGQIKYHKDNSRDLSIIDQRLHWLANGLFASTFVACAVHFGLSITMEMLPVWAGILLITLNAVLPAFGAAIAAIRSQGEFHRIAQRSLAMYEELDDLKLALSQIAACGNELKSQDMRRIIDQTARLMINETLDWRIVFQDRPLALPA
ncbi:MAG: DUF4231 domain-containing protein [Acidobacteria bacterium]|nr:DUF4231 domain-containing protein [Acidobacteriota bacterium]